jgi:hypothetical protein
VNTYTNDIASFASRLLLVAAVLMYSYATASADNAKKSVAGKQQKSVASPVLPMASGTVYASVKAVASRTKALAKTSGKVNAGNDSTGRDNRILFARTSGDVFTSRIELATEEPLIEIGIYNMLGKRVMDVYKGASGRGQQEFTQSLAELPDGVYICILQGDNFRKAEKFYFRR